MKLVPVTSDTEMKRTSLSEPLERLARCRPLAQATAVALALLVLAGGAGCDAATRMKAPGPSPIAAPPSEEAPGQTPALDTPTAPVTPVPKELVRRGPPLRPPLEIKATLGQDAVLPGQHISVTWSIENVSPNHITLRPFPPETTVQRMRIVEWPSGEDDLVSGIQVVRLNPAGSREVTLQPGEQTTHSLVWDQRGIGGWPVAPGYYDLSVGVNVEAGSARIGGSNRARVLIQFPQGAMEKTVDVNQPLTAGGVTVTLKRVELSATGTKVYAFNPTSAV